VTPIRIGTRASRLALAQAELAADALRAGGAAVAIVPLSTAGDRDVRRSFAEIGARGVFATEIEAALLAGRIDVAAHSAKDLTDPEDERLVIAACLERGDPRDAWCGPARSWDEVPQGARVGTASLRRGSQLGVLRPDLRVEPLRGNVETRLRKRTERGLDGVVLAACGLDRLGRPDEIGFRISLAEMIPETGQGIIALQVRRGEDELVAVADHGPTRETLEVERAVTAAIGGGCTVPVGVHAERTAGGWRVHVYRDGRSLVLDTADPSAAAGQFAREAG
jgi:hydroxymethylbilane synthase